MSIFTADEVKVALLPAKSVAVTVPVTADPSVINTNGLLAGFVEARPDRVSAAVNENETLVLFHPLALADGLAAPNVSVGAVASRLIVTDCELVPPMLVAWQVKVVPEVSDDTLLISHPVIEATVDSGSVTVQFTVTLLMYQPLLPKVPVTDGVITGGVMSAG